MLSYQHIYHAGNWADVHKHWLLAGLLAQFKQKPKPISYFETHAGRGRYDLNAPEAQKTAEAQNAIFSPSVQKAIEKSTFGVLLRQTQKTFGPASYCGSPLIAQSLLDGHDKIHLAELHPQEYRHLNQAMDTRRVSLYPEDGFAMVKRHLPPMPRRGLVFVDPSYEIKSDYTSIPAIFSKWQKQWNVGLFVLWYPILRDGGQELLTAALKERFAQAAFHEVYFHPPHARYRMIGSGFFISNAPYGTEALFDEVQAFFDKRHSDA